jgi:magnesium-transporting ATPase (P-type)
VEKSRDSFFDGKTLTELHYFTNRYLKYLIRDNRVEVCQYTHCQDKYAECMSHSAKGWRNEEALQLAKTFGQGAMVIEKPTAISIFVEEIFSPLYIFLIINVLLNWEVEYKSFAVFIGMSAIGGLVITVREVMQVSEKIFAMAYYEVQLDVFREGQVQKVSSLDIVPGDIVFFSEAVKLPFEGVLLEGEMLMNECALTGESIPVAKKGDDLEKYQRKEGLSKGCLLYEGTTILQINNYKPMKVW